MNKNTTNEFSFILKPSKFGVGVFATHNIAKDTYLRLFGDEKTGVETGSNERFFDIKDIPEPFQSYCVNFGKKLMCPADFGRMPIGWYLNHSKTPNALNKDYDYYASRDIKEGEEILIDYNSLQEPEEVKEDYYKN